MSSTYVLSVADMKPILAKAATDFAFPRGNVNIKVRVEGSLVLGKVSAEAMALASEVFGNIVYPPWQRQTPATHVVDFSGDNYKALLLLLRIIHHQGSLVPQTITLGSQLYEVCRLIEYYQCHSVVQPWLDRWVRSFVDGQFNRGDPDLPRETFAYIFWVAGAGWESHLRELAEQLYRAARVDEDGEYLTKGGEELPEDFLWPYGLKENILASREYAVGQILLINRTILEMFNPSKPTPGPPVSCGRRECCTTVFYSLLHAMREQKLYYHTKADDITESVEELSFRIERIPYHTLCYDVRSARDVECMRPLNRMRAVDMLMRGVENPVDESHVTHMEMARQALEVGWMRPDGGRGPRYGRQ